jgi:hypothetical protein
MDGYDIWKVYYPYSYIEISSSTYEQYVLHGNSWRSRLLVNPGYDLSGSTSSLIVRRIA